MTVSLVSWRAVIGIFNCRISVMSKICESHLVNNFTCLIESLLLFYHYFESAYIVLFTLLYIFPLLQCHGDIELNPGPQKLLNNNSLSICHWNLNSEGLLYKLKSMGVSGELYNLLENYLSDRFQRVLLNGQTSSWRPVLAGVPQG